LGIDVSLIEPGPIRTEFAGRAMEHLIRHSSPKSPYAAIYARADDLLRMNEAQAIGPEQVSRAIEHAAFARRPRVRYVVPWRHQLVVSLAAVLPTQLTDYLLCRMVGLTRERLLAAAPAGESAPTEA
jgi:short-subunit dehydrogenase